MRQEDFRFNQREIVASRDSMLRKRLTILRRLRKTASNPKQLDEEMQLIEAEQEKRRIRYEQERRQQASGLTGRIAAANRLNELTDAELNEGKEIEERVLRRVEQMQINPLTDVDELLIKIVIWETFFDLTRRTK